MTLVRMLRTRRHAGRTCTRGETLELPEGIASAWIAHRIAVHADTPSGEEEVVETMESLEDLSKKELLEIAEGLGLEPGRASKKKLIQMISGDAPEGDEDE